ncbi:E3 ubiquitin-protein ligase [Dirofilaria immitis]
MIHSFLNYWIWYVILVFLPISILLMAIFIAAYIYFFTSSIPIDSYNKLSDFPETQDILDSHNNDRPRLMSRFLTQAELQKVFMLPEYMPRNLNLTSKDREFLNKASKVQCLRSDQKVTTEDYLNVVDTAKFIHN